MNELLLTSGELAVKLNLPRWRLLYLLEKGDLPGPSYKVPGRRLFTAEDVERIVATIEKNAQENSSISSNRRDKRHAVVEASAAG